ncbi:MAG TPA: cytochrome c biogenesis protein CcdA, partial [Verrucomicrobiae bacterium]|nr:cytochrome c biogenesis protein CcdA [Verrucomicrobiae bacterium]
FLHKEKRIDYTPKSSSSLGSSFMLGIVFAAGWTPCIGPILASILVYAGSVETVNQGIALLVAYSLGLALPFFLAALLAGSVSSKIKNINRYLPYITKASGVLMVILGYLVFNNKLAWLNSYFNFFGS